MKPVLSKHAYIYIALMGMSLSFMLVSSVRAQTDETTVPGIAPRMEERVENREARAEERQEMREERKAALMEQVQNRIINLASNVTKRLSAGVARLANIIERLDSRIIKLADANVDTAAAEAKLTEAKTALSDTRAALDAIPSVEDAISGDTPKDAYKAVRTQFVAVRDGLRKTHTSLIEAVALLKNAVAEAESARGVSGAVTDAPSEKADADEDTTTNTAN